MIIDEAFGYCFVVPAEFTYEQPSETNAHLFAGSMMDVEHPKLMIEVIDANGCVPSRVPGRVWQI